MDTRTLLQRIAAAKKKYEELGGHNAEREAFHRFALEQEKKKLAHKQAKEALKKQELLSV